jgi:hypothetical protein
LQRFSGLPASCSARNAQKVEQLRRCSSRQITQNAIDKFILDRGNEIERSTLNKDVRILKAFVNWRRENRNRNGAKRLQFENNAPLDFEPPPYQWNNSWGDWGSRAMRLACIDRHAGAINAVFLDSSVGKMPLRGLWKWNWHRSYNINGPWTSAGGAQLSDWPGWMRNYRE